MTDPEGLKQRDSVGFIFNFAANSKEYAAMKLVLFLSAWAVVALMGILLIYRYSGLNTFDILQLREHAKLMNIPVSGRRWTGSFGCSSSSALPRSPRSGRCIRGRPSAMRRRPPPPACCMPAC